MLLTLSHNLKLLLQKSLFIGEPIKIYKDAPQVTYVPEGNIKYFEK